MVILAACLSVELCCLLLLEDYVLRLQPSVKSKQNFYIYQLFNVYFAVVIILSYILYYVWIVISVNAPR